jgi:hypothetical protein
MIEVRHHTHMPLAIIAAAVVAIGLQAGPTRGAVGPATWQFPGGCNGQTTLQGCITNVAQPGDTIEIVTNSPIAETPTITKSLTLDSGAGFQGSISGGAHVTATSGTLDVTLHDLSFDGGILVNMTGGSGHHLTLDHLTVTNGTTTGLAGVYMSTTVPATLDATSNVIHVTHGTATQMYLEAANDTGTATFRVIGNRMDGNGGDNSFGGVQLILDGSGTARADILNNSVWDVAGCGCVGGAGVYYRVNSPATDDVNVVGNTFDHAVTGVFIQTLTTTGGHYSLDLFNNVISHPTAQGVTIDSFQNSAEFTLRAGNNDYYDLGQPNNFNGYPSGTDNLALAPKFVAPLTGDLRLKATSPLINKGVVCSPGGVARLDAAGNFRLAGPTVDVGAYERGAGPPTGIVFVGSSDGDSQSGTAGADILCGYGGADFLNGKGGNDYVDGGSASDIVKGGSGADRLFGGASGDTLCAKDGVNGNDYLNGGRGTDDYRADSGDVRVSVEHVGTCP